MLKKIYLFILVLISINAIISALKWFHEFPNRFANPGHLFHHWSTVVVLLFLIPSPISWYIGLYRNSLLGRIIFMLIATGGILYLIYWAYLTPMPRLYVNSYYVISGHVVSVIFAGYGITVCLQKGREGGAKGVAH